MQTREGIGSGVRGFPGRSRWVIYAMEALPCIKHQHPLQRAVFAICLLNHLDGCPGGSDGFWLSWFGGISQDPVPCVSAEDSRDVMPTASLALALWQPRRWVRDGMLLCLV